MEIELKYKIPTPELAEEIWKDKLFFRFEENGSREDLYFTAKYFDTPDRDLSDNRFAYRVRKEGKRWVAALKWKDHIEGALHTRNEINVTVEDDTPDLSVFRESIAGASVIELTAGKELSCFLETRFRRRRFRIDTRTGIFELSVDQGNIVTPYGEDIISEVEIELFTGKTEELKALGEKLRRKYRLEKETESKYGKGLDIIRKHI